MMSGALREKYDALFLDCPPGISLLSENVLRAADAVIIPMLPTPLSVRMLAQLNEFISEEGWSDIVVLPFFSMVDRRKSLHHAVIESTRAQFPAILATEIKYASEIERMSLRRAPLPAYAPARVEGQMYSALWSEIAARIGMTSRQACKNASQRLLRAPSHRSSSAQRFLHRLDCLVHLAGDIGRQLVRQEV